MTLKCCTLLSNLAFNFNLRHYTEEAMMVFDELPPVEAEEAPVEAEEEEEEEYADAEFKGRLR